MNYGNSKQFKEMAIDEIRSFAKLHRSVVAAGLVKIGSGSSRSVYDLKDGNVLKVAKNARGIAQNEVESYLSFSSYDVCAKVIESSEKLTWLVMEKCEKITKKEFALLTGVSFDSFVLQLRHDFLPRSAYYSVQNGRAVADNDFYSEVARTVSDNDLKWGDVARLSNLGKVKRDGKWQVVLLDFGLNSESWELY